MSRTGIATYSGDPSTSPLDEVRFLIGDTGPNFDLNNAEINYQFKIVYGDPLPVGQPPAHGNFLPAAYCADAIAAFYKKLVDKTVGDLQISYSSMQKIANDLNPDTISTAVKIDGMDNAPPLHSATGSGVDPSGEN